MSLAVYQGQQLGPRDLAIFITTPPGDPVNVAQVSFEIQSLEDPESPVTVVAETSAVSNRASAGVYYANWLVPLDAYAGNWQIVWRWRVESGDAQQEQAFPFQVMAFSGSAGAELYISPADLYAEGVPETFTAAYLIKKIRFAQQYIERITQHFFLPRYREFLLDGEGIDLLPLPQPILRITALAIANSPGVFEEQPLIDYAIYDNPDAGAQWNPRIKIASMDNVSIYSRIPRNGVFPEGTQNIRVRGWFGFCEQDWTTPLPIQEACKLLVLKWLHPLYSKKAGRARRDGQVISETTDGHSVTLDRAMRMGVLTGDAEIDSILIEYARGPRATMT